MMGVAGNVGCRATIDRMQNVLIDGTRAGVYDDAIRSRWSGEGEGRQMAVAANAALKKGAPRFSRTRMGVKRAMPVARGVEARARELITMAAHDLRSPLAAIGFRAHHIVQRWKEGERPRCEEWASVVVGICTAVEDASRMISDLLAMERLDQGGERAPPAAIDVQAIIEKAIERERLALERARCRVTVLRQKGLTSARGDWDRPYLLRVFGNLLRNAARHAPGAPILITLARRGDRLAIVVADRGPGLPVHTRRLGRSALNEPDLDAEIHGLGLWIVRRAVHRLHGRLRIHSRAGAGVTFDIELPGLAR